MINVLLVLLAIVLVVVIVGLFWTQRAYNRLVELKNKAESSWANIDVELKRRHDLIGNLVETVKGYAGHENATLKDVVAARYEAMNASSPDQKVAAENRLSGALANITVIGEQYPDLKADQNFRQLSEQLTETEDRLAHSRAYLNDIVRAYNTALTSVPSNVVARFIKATPLAYYQLESADEREAPQVSFEAP